MHIANSANTAYAFIMLPSIHVATIVALLIDVLLGIMGSLLLLRVQVCDHVCFWSILSLSGTLDKVVKVSEMLQKSTVDEAFPAVILHADRAFTAAVCRSG